MVPTTLVEITLIQVHEYDITVASTVRKTSRDLREKMFIRLTVTDTVTQVLIS